MVAKTYRGPQVKIRLFKTRNGAGRYVDKLRKQHPDKHFRIAPEPKGFNHCVVQYDIRNPDRIIAYCA